MSKRNLKTLLALLLAACMLLSGIGAFAAPTVQVTEPAPGEAVVDITGTVSGTDKGMDSALEVYAYYDEDTKNEGVNVQVGGEYVPNLVDPADYQKVSDALENAQTVTVNVGEVVETDTTGSHPPKTEYNEETGEDETVLDDNGDPVPDPDQLYGNAAGIYVDNNISADRDIVVNADSIKAEVILPGSSGDNSARATGVTVLGNYGSKAGSGSTTVNVSGDVSAKAEGGTYAEAVGIYADVTTAGAAIDVTVQGDISSSAKSDGWGDAYGGQVSANGGDIKFKVNDITSMAEGKGEDMSAYGVQAGATDGGTANVETGNITASSEKEDAFGLFLTIDDENRNPNPNNTVKATVNGDINVSTEQDNRGFGVYAYGTKDGSISAQVNGEINIDTKGEQGESYGVNADQWRKGQVDVKVDGDVNVTSACSIKSADPDPASESIGVGSTASWDDAVANVDVNGNVTVTNAGHDARGIDAVSGGGAVNINVNGDISATGGMTGVGINAYITEQDGYDDPVTGEWVEEQSQGGHSNVKVKGNVTASVADDGFYARGISALSNNDGAIEVGVLGDVTAKGKEAVGLQFTKTEGSDLTVLVDGTLSGETAAVATTTGYYYEYIGADGTTQKSSDTYDYDNANLYVWAATPNKDGVVAVAYDYNETIKEGETRIDEYGDPYTEEDTVTDERVVNKEASEAVEKAIWYIIKVAADFQNTLTAAGTNTYTYDGTTYDLAHQDENVTGTYRINADEEGLDGVYYNADDKIEAKAGEWKDNGDGSFWVKMLRGGAMMLGLKTHRHQKAAREVAGSRVAPTCTAAGGYDEETYCTVCGKVFATEHKNLAALGHTAGAAVREKEVAASCTAEGSYDEVVYCTVCKAEISRSTVKVDKRAHTPGEPVRENIVAARAGVAGGYDEVVYCDVCGEELSRTHVDVPALAAVPAAPATPMELVYEPVDELHGVKPADHPAADEAMAAVGAALDGEDVTVEILGVEKLLDAEELQQFNTLPVKDRLLVVLSALGFANETLGDIGGMSEDAQALADTVAERMAQLPEDEKQALLQTMAEAFPKGTVTIDGQTYDSFSIDLVIDRAGEKTYERYTFYDDNGAWKLYGVEQGEYRPVEA